MQLKWMALCLMRTGITRVDAQAGQAGRATAEILEPSSKLVYGAFGRRAFSQRSTSSRDEVDVFEVGDWLIPDPGVDRVGCRVGEVGEQETEPET